MRVWTIVDCSDLELVCCAYIPITLYYWNKWSNVGIFRKKALAVLDGCMHCIGLKEHRNIIALLNKRGMTPLKELLTFLFLISPVKLNSLNSIDRKSTHFIIGLYHYILLLCTWILNTHVLSKLCVCLSLFVQERDQSFHTFVGLKMYLWSLWSPQHHIKKKQKTISSSEQTYRLGHWSAYTWSKSCNQECVSVKLKTQTLSTGMAQWEAKYEVGN